MWYFVADQRVAFIPLENSQGLITDRSCRLETPSKGGKTKAKVASVTLVGLKLVAKLLPRAKRPSLIYDVVLS